MSYSAELAKSSMNVQESCPFCVQTRNETALGQRTILAETPAVRLFPSLGPLHDGHVLLVTKTHHTGVRTMPTTLLHEVIDMVGRIEDAFSRLFSADYILFENGTHFSNRGGCSIVHYHLHAVPVANAKGFARSLSGSSPAPLLKALQQARDAPFDYTIFGSRHFGFRVFDRTNHPSQYMRKAVAEWSGNPRWDWRKHPTLLSGSQSPTLRRLLEAMQITSMAL